MDTFSLLSSFLTFLLLFTSFIMPHFSVFIPLYYILHSQSCLYLWYSRLSPFYLSHYFLCSRLHHFVVPYLNSSDYPCNLVYSSLSLNYMILFSFSILCFIFLLLWNHIIFLVIYLSINTLVQLRIQYLKLLYILYYNSIQSLLHSSLHLSDPSACHQLTWVQALLCFSVSL